MQVPLLPQVHRSIPACAGEPPARGGSGRIDEVYPRVCGGTTLLSFPPAVRGGLSPRVRGNPSPFDVLPDGEWSIPACAGEPLYALRPSLASRVYPRVCGGTVAVGLLVGGFLGLSPRVRGNPEGGQARSGGGGSIPACAGEPKRRSGGRSGGRVYPRVCGGTLMLLTKIRRGRGLSPRVRGNPGPRSGPRGPQRSIPACAGEPLESAPGPGKRWVYPRVCGGTLSRSGPPPRLNGLSPRVRGNPGAG